MKFSTMLFSIMILVHNSTQYTTKFSMVFLGGFELTDWMKWMNSIDRCEGSKKEIFFPSPLIFFSFSLTCIFTENELSILLLLVPIAAACTLFKIEKKILKWGNWGKRKGVEEEMKNVSECFQSYWRMWENLSLWTFTGDFLIVI